MQIIHVDLGRAGSGYSGSFTDPYSWADVRARLQLVQDSILDSGTGFDSGSSFDGSVVNLVFKCRGRGEILNLENSIALANMNFSSTGSIVFTHDDPAENGLPVLASPTFGVGSTPVPVLGSWFGVSSSINFKLTFQGFVFDVNNPFGFDGANLVSSEGSHALTKFANNIVIDRGTGIRYVNVSGAGSRTSFAGNTILLASTSTGTHECVRDQDGALFVGLNYVGQAPGSSSVMIFGTAPTTLYTHANAFALKPSSILYQGAAPSKYSDDVVGVDALTQGIFNSNILDITKPDASAALTAGLRYVESSTFWPVHGGKLLRSGSVAIPLAVDLGACEVDAFGYQRLSAAQDSGAFQKSMRTEPATLHVDLSSATRSGLGTEEDPIGVAEFVQDHSRRAPVDYDLTYVLRGRNSTELTLLDLGPLSPNAGVADRTYGGIGKVTLTGYRTYNRKLPVLRCRRIAPHQQMLVIFEKLKLEFVGGTDFIYGTVVTPGRLRVRSCVLRSTTDALGLFVRSGVGTSKVMLHGCTVVQKHSAGTLSGIFSFSENTTIDACAVNMLNQTVVGTGPVSLRGCSISSGTGSACTWAGATTDAYTDMNATNAFVDPDNVDYDAADFRLSSNSSAINKLPDAALYPESAEDLERDARGMKRSAFPLGSKSADAGAFEYDFYVPEPVHKYLDLSKSRSGSGTLHDRWNPADFQAYCDSLHGSLIDRRVFVHCTRSGPLHLHLQELEADVNGGFTLVSDAQPSLWMADTAPNVELRDCYGISVTVAGMLLRNESGLESCLVQGTSSDIDLANTIVDNKRRNKGIRINLVASVLATDIIDVDGTTLVPGTDFEIGDTNVETAKNIETVLVGFGLQATARGSSVLLSAAYTSEVTGTAAYEIIEVDSVIRAPGNYVRMRGCSVNDEFAGEIGVVGVAVRAEKADIAYSCFQGHQLSPTTRSGAYVIAASGTTFQNRCNIFSAGTGVVDTGTAIVGSQLFLELRAEDTDVAAFELAGSASVDAFSAPALPSLFQGIGDKVDIRGNFRSRVFIDAGEDRYDVGAVERYFLDAASAFSGDIGEPRAEVTDVGYSLNDRALAGTLRYSLVGFAFGRGGYVYWDPTKPQPFTETGRQARTRVRVVSNTITVEEVNVSTPLGAVSVQAGVDFDAGTTAAETAQNIAAALRQSAVFNNAAFAVVDGVDVHLYLHIYGPVSGFSVSVAGPALQSFSTQAGIAPAGVVEQVYPATGYLPWNLVEVPDPRSRGFVSRVDEGSFSYGELAVVARVHDSVYPSEVGREYVYARVRLPMSTKHSRKTIVNRVLFAY